jgi:ABC-2 type transport system permease protein
MLSTVFRWELRALRRDPAFWLVGGLALAALGFALANGSAWRGYLDGLRVSAARVDADLAAKSRADAAELDRKPNPLIIATRDPRNPYGFAHFQMQHSIVLPATPLAALTVGQSDLLPQTLLLNPGPPPSLLGSAEPENPYRLLIGPFDAAFVVVSLAPLLVIALTFGLVAGERERGTLPLLLAQPLTLRAWIAGRLAPRALLGLLLLAALTAGFLFVSPSPALVLSPASASAAPRLALWLAVALAYGAFWFALSLAVATRRGSSAMHALVLASLWLGLVVLVPAGINLAVKTLHPVPSRIEQVLAMRASTDEIAAQTSRHLAAYYEDHPEFAPKAGAATEYSEIRFITNEKLDRALAPVLARYDAQLARQQSLVERLSFLSPALLAHAAFADAAGTGLARHREFLRQAVTHHADLRAFFNPRILKKEKFTAWDEVPAFTFDEEPTEAAAARIAPALLALFIATAAFAVWSAGALRRSSPSA